MSCRSGVRTRARRYRTELYRGAVGRNWYECDPTLQFLMRRYLGADGLAWATPHLTALGALMGGPIAERAEETDRNPPRLERYDRWGHEVSRVVMPPTFEASRQDLIEMGFGSEAFREQARAAGVDPAPLNAAWSYLLDQAEIGMACALGTGGDMVVRLAEEFAPEDVKPRVRELFAAGEMSGEAAQMLTERTGGSDLAALETTATPEGEAWRLNGFKWFASNANGSAFVVLAKPEGAPDGIRGIAPFLVLWERRDGGRNGIRIRRLKDKLGTKAVASAEVEFVDAEAFMLAPSGTAGSGEAAGDGRGLARMMELTNGARLGHLDDGTRVRPAGAGGVALLRAGAGGVRRRARQAPADATQARRAHRRGRGRPGAHVRRLPRPAPSDRRPADQAARRPPRHHRGQRRDRDPRRQRLHRAVAGRPAAARRPGQHDLGGPGQHPLPRRAPRDRA